jgi:hypothetical protein
LAESAWSGTIDRAFVFCAPLLRNEFLGAHANRVPDHLLPRPSTF